ncbi:MULTISPECIES: hypothetical protein [unclassified Rhodococcus (in: high G+C Gram-positive bacteria)]|uniref:hypothetical protein n=1 Tax=unclassified Rhodococcus (in: high G+C Gram-positive bacteria) TaxID=192944 RepID=UPI0007BC1D7C|nr:MULTISPECIES: hypothetical protein [unclassified Rhodococcus (in: high G+C Gram-positive bacteria)]KZF07310.1 hypothetical protein A2J02_01805 [Rhodococcus sp. EPR-147]KZF07888.1 hypothetical protein A2J04_02330 [Rhodococcus sp. EPR-279]
MSRPTDYDGAPSHGVPDIVAMSGHIASLYTDAIAVYRDLLRHIAADRTLSHRDPRWPIDDHPVEGPSLTVPGLRIHMRHSYQDAGDLGSFPAEGNPLLLRIHVQGFSDEYQDRTAARSNLVDSVTDPESEAWTRALLGERWADYAYELVRTPNPPKNPATLMRFAQRVYVLLLDTDGQPTLAPDNFAFQRVWDGIDSARKIIPTSPAVAAHLSAVGPFFETADIRDPNTEADGAWRLHITGDDTGSLPTPASTTAQNLIRRVRVRGRVDTKFRPIRVHVEQDQARVYFRWAKNPNTFAITLRLPQSEDDFSGPPLNTPDSIVAVCLSSWQEDLRTGLLVWGQRTREADGAIHISWPITEMSGSRQHRVAAVPRHDTSGSWLAETGLNIGTAREALKSGVLACWLQAYLDNREVRPFVGHAAARWVDDTTACIDVLEVVPGTRGSVATQLLHSITHTLANAGARAIELPFTDESFAEFGYVPNPTTGHGMYLDVTTMP